MLVGLKFPKYVLFHFENECTTSGWYQNCLYSTNDTNECSSTPITWMPYTNDINECITSTTTMNVTYHYEDIIGNAVSRGTWNVRVRVESTLVMRVGRRWVDKKYFVVVVVVGVLIGRCPKLERLCLETTTNVAVHLFRGRHRDRKSVV